MGQDLGAIVTARSHGRDQGHVGVATVRDRDRGRRGEVTTRCLNLGRGLGVEDERVSGMTVYLMGMLIAARSGAEHQQTLTDLIWTV